MLVAAEERQIQLFANALSYHPTDICIDVILRGPRGRIVNLPGRVQNDLGAVAGQVCRRDREYRCAVSSTRDVVKIAELFASDEIEGEFLAWCVIEMGV